MCTPASGNPYRYRNVPNVLFDVFYCKSYLDVLNCRLCNPTTTASFPQAHCHRHQLHDAHGQPRVQILNMWHPSSQVWFAMAYSDCGCRWYIRSFPKVILLTKKSVASLSCRCWCLYPKTIFIITDGNSSLWGMFSELPSLFYNQCLLEQ
jgi:hypothetical protein